MPASDRTPLLGDRQQDLNGSHSAINASVASAKALEAVGHGDAESTPRGQQPPPAPTDRFNVAIISVGFCILFCAFNTLQNYVTSLLPGSLGNESLAVLYASVCLSVFITPTVVAFLGEKRTVILGAICYLVYLASVIEVVPGVVLAAAVVIGFGAAIIWVAGMNFLRMCSHPAEYGTNIGVFWAVFQMSNVLGNLSAYFLFKHVGKTALFISFLAVGAVGTMLFFLLRPLSQSARGSLSTATQPRQPILQEVIAILRAIFTYELLMLAGIMIFTGLELSFWSGEFPQLLPAKAIGIVLVFAGVGEVVGGTIISPLSDKMGNSAALVFGSVTYGIGMYLSTLLMHGNEPEPHFLEASWVAYVAAFCFGIGDSVFNTQVFAIIPRLFAVRQDVHSFTVYQLHQNIGSTLGFFYAIGVPMHGDNGTLTQIWVQVGLLSVGTVGFVIIDRFAARHHPKE
eukprot:m.17729 g.17729  ORF g.17729 m.17729 type:complete len:456 (-) comp7980_c0_seq1:159-1526(-)